MTAVCISLVCVAIGQTDAGKLLTVGERSDYQATARYEEVRDFLKRLAEASPRVRLGSMGTSVEGREIPLVILADPPVSTAEEAKRSGKLVVLAFGGIHAGEICGKEALLMIARELATTPDPPLLKKFVIVFAPILNVDGNERVSKDNRPGQNGPAEGMGQRHNAQDLDLNRDFIKLESPEVQALVRFLNEWDPAMTIDTHTTNGSHHRYTLTFDGPRLPTADGEVIAYVNETMLPSISRTMERDNSYRSFFYGNFEEGHTRWETYPPQGRFGTPYRGLRNRIDILSEAYAYAPFRDRVLATKAFVEHCLTYVAGHDEDVRRLINQVDERTTAAGTAPKPDDMVSIRHRLAAFPKKVTVDGYVEEMRDGHPRATDELKSYEVEFFGRAEPTLSVRRPYAYLFPATFEQAARKLREHGLYVERLIEDIKTDVEVYTIDKIERAVGDFQNHRLVTVEATADVQTRRFSRGAFLVRTGQKLGALAVYLLEPQSDDGLCTWNFFDESLETGRDFPVYRLLQPAPVLTDPLRP